MLNARGLTLAIAICCRLWQGNWESVSRRAFGSGHRWLRWTAMTCNYAVLILVILMLLKRVLCRFHFETAKVSGLFSELARSSQDVACCPRGIKSFLEDVQAQSSRSIFPLWLHDYKEWSDCLKFWLLHICRTPSTKLPPFLCTHCRPARGDLPTPSLLCLQKRGPASSWCISVKYRSIQKRKKNAVVPRTPLLLGIAPSSWPKGEEMQSTPAKTDSALSWNPQTNNQTQRLYLSEGSQVRDTWDAAETSSKTPLVIADWNISMLHSFPTNACS